MDMDTDSEEVDNFGQNSSAFRSWFHQQPHTRLHDGAGIQDMREQGAGRGISKISEWHFF